MRRATLTYSYTNEQMRMTFPAGTVVTVLSGGDQVETWHVMIRGHKHAEGIASFELVDLYTTLPRRLMEFP